MIFLDQSGKRWRRIKITAAVAVVAATVPVGTMLAGSLAYQPIWGQLPLVHQLEVLAANATGSATPPTPPAVATVPPTPRPVRHTAFLAARTTPPVAPISLVRSAVAPAATPVITPVPPTPVPPVAPRKVPTPPPAATSASTPKHGGHGQGQD